MNVGAKSILPVRTSVDHSNTCIRIAQIIITHMMFKSLKLFSLFIHSFRKSKRLVRSCIVVADEEYLASAHPFNARSMRRSRRRTATFHANAQNSSGSGKRSEAKAHCISFSIDKIDCNLFKINKNKWYTHAHPRPHTATRV